MKNISVLALLIRHNFYKVLAVIVLMVSVEGFIFYRFLGEHQEVLASAEGMISDTYVSGVFKAAFVAIFFVLCITENNLGKKSGSTILRLKITLKRFFAIKTIYNVFCIVLLFVVQIWFVIFMIRMYGRHIGEALAGPQQLFLTFYRNAFLHSLLPMAEVGKWIKNILMILAYAMQAAVNGKKNHVGDIWLYICIENVLISEIGLNIADMICDLMSITVIAVVLLKTFDVFKEEE